MKKQRYLLHAILFLITLLTTCLAGTEWVTARQWLMSDAEGNLTIGLGLSDLAEGLTYSFAFLSFLTFHEFGHYFLALYHNVRCSLPYYIPVFIPGFFNIGSFGAVIRMREVPTTTKKFFDIGIAGPLAGFVVSVCLLVYGFLTLPPLDEKVLGLHPEYQAEFGGVPTEEQLIEAYSSSGALYGIGTSLMFEFFKITIAPDPSQVPPPFELMHYPFLFVGFITLFFTALNLLPIGQLDGGHVIYGLFGRKIAGIVSRVAVVFLVLAGGAGVVDFESKDSIIPSLIFTAFLIFVYSRMFPRMQAWKVGLAALLTIAAEGGIFFFVPTSAPSLIWLIYSFIAVRFLGVDHPPALVEHKLDGKRRILGWLAVVIFILCFTPNPLFTYP